MTDHPPLHPDRALNPGVPPHGMKPQETAGTHPPTVEKLLTYEQVAELLGVTPRTVFKLVAEGELRAARLGGSVRFDPADLRAYIDRCKTGAKGVDHDSR